MIPLPSLPYVLAMIQAAVARVSARRMAERTIRRAVRPFDDLHPDPPKH